MEYFGTEEKEQLKEMESYYRLSTDKHLAMCEAAAEERLNLLEWQAFFADDIDSRRQIPMAMAVLEIIRYVMKSRQNGI